MTAGIFAPYSRCETTLNAVRLASTLRRAGWTIRWLAPWRSTPSQPVHYAWDDQVRLTDRDRLSEWAAKCARRIWFDLDSKALRTAQERCSGVSDVLVVSNPSPTLSDLPDLLLFNEVVCADSARAAVLQRVASPEAIIRHCHWSTGLKHIVRRGISSPGLPLLCLHADAYTCRRAGDQLFKAVALLLANTPVFVNLVIETTPSKKQKEMLACFGPERLKWVCRGDFRLLTALIYSSDWFVDASLRHSSMALVHQARRLGVPSFAWDVYPACSVIAHGSDGYLIPSVLTVTDTGAETAVWNTPALVSVISAFAADLSQLSKLQYNCAQRAAYENQELSFERFWVEALEPSRPLVG
jgi:hypothetical protein